MPSAVPPLHPSVAPFTVGGKGGAEVREEMILICADIARAAKPPRHATAKIAAAKAVLDNLPTEEPLDVLVKLLGDERSALEWMEAALPALRARLATRVSLLGAARESPSAGAEGGQVTGDDCQDGKHAPPEQ